MQAKHILTRTKAKIAVQAQTPSALSSPNSPSISNGATQNKALTTAISRILQIGVILSSAMIVAGLVLMLLQVRAMTPHYLQAFPHTPEQVWIGLLSLQPQAVIASGLLLLIATPVLRVVVSIIAFNSEHDRRYAFIALILLAILLTSFMLGKGGT
jgi:uncharacterized membrane protein